MATANIEPGLPVVLKMLAILRFNVLVRKVLMKKECSGLFAYISIKLNLTLFTTLFFLDFLLFCCRDIKTEF